METSLVKARVQMRHLDAKGVHNVDIDYFISGQLLGIHWDTRVAVVNMADVPGGGSPIWALSTGVLDAVD